MRQQQRQRRNSFKHQRITGGGNRKGGGGDEGTEETGDKIGMFDFMDEGRGVEEEMGGEDE